MKSFFAFLLVILFASGSPASAEGDKCASLNEESLTFLMVGVAAGLEYAELRAEVLRKDAESGGDFPGLAIHIASLGEAQKLILKSARQSVGRLKLACERADLLMALAITIEELREVEGRESTAE